jgi:hypothetical protein
MPTDDAHGVAGDRCRRRRHRDLDDHGHGARRERQPVAGQAVSLAATGSNNTLVQPGVTDPFGVATGTIASTTAEQKTITATVNPGASQVVVAQQPTVDFVGDPSTINALQSTATAAPALGCRRWRRHLDDHRSRCATCNGNPVAAKRALAATGSNNTLVQPGLTDRDRCRDRHDRQHDRRDQDDHRHGRTRASQVVIAQQPTVQFVGDSSTSVRCRRRRVAGDRRRRRRHAISTITVTVRDLNGNPSRARRAARRDRQQQHAGAAGVTDPFGVATGTIASITAETKTITGDRQPGREPGRLSAAADGALRR